MLLYGAVNARGNFVGTSLLRFLSRSSLARTELEPFVLVVVGNKVQFQKMNRALETGGVIPLVDKVFEFEQLKEAYEYLQSGKQIGKVVVRVSSD
jgi:NADPH:quinone reductase-like Zn-dependent oxidoreductase